MKHHIAITIEKDLIKELDAQVKSGKFRSRSHAIEYYVKQAMLRGM